MVKRVLMLLVILSTNLLSNENPNTAELVLEYRVQDSISVSFKENAGSSVKGVIEEIEVSQGKPARIELEIEAETDDFTIGYESSRGENINLENAEDGFSFQELRLYNGENGEAAADSVTARFKGQKVKEVRSGIYKQELMFQMKEPDEDTRGSYENDLVVTVTSI